MTRNFTVHALFTIFVPLAVVLLDSGCANSVGDADEEEPFDDRSNEQDQGLYDCSEDSATGYRNGSSFSIKVVRVDGKPVQVDTANAYLAMQAKAKRDGINLRIVSGFRSMSEQEYLYGCYVNCSCNSCNLAARPGYSNHQSGHALDLNTSDGGVYGWLASHADEFGFARTVPSEQWHWEWWGNHSDYSGPCGGPPIPAKCQSGHYHGAFCDDDGKNDEDSHDRLKDDLGVNFHCKALGGNPAFCGADEADRADAIFVLGAAAKMPLGGHPNAFVDDNDSSREKYFDAAKDYEILLGYAHRKVKPTNAATRNALASMMARMYKLPATSHDYFRDDDGDPNEATHNKVAAAGLMLGYAHPGAQRRDFKGTAKANRDTLATLALRAHDKGLVPVWDIPDACLRGNFTGAFCDDDGRGDEAQIDRLAGELAVTWSCPDLAGKPAFCPKQQVSRAELMYALGKAAAMPVDATYADGFRDDDGHRRERYLNAAKAWGIILGYNGGRDAKPDKIANRDTLAIVLARMYALPDAAQDYFSDDDGTSVEAWHNKVAAAGLFSGYDDGHGGRKFNGGDVATKAMVAVLASRAKDAGLVPVWAATTTMPAPAPSAPDDPPADVGAPGIDDSGPLGPDDIGLFGDDPEPGEPALVDDETGMSLVPDDELEAAPAGLGAPRVHGGCSAVGADTAGFGATVVLVLGVLARRRRALG